MKKLITALMCATMVFGLSGCGESRKALDSKGVKANFDEAGVCGQILGLT